MVDISVYMQFVLFTDIHNSSNGIHEGSLKLHLKASKFFAHMTQKVIGGNITTWHLSSSSKSYRVHTRKTTNLFQVTDTLFNSPGPKVHVNYCHHLASVVCCLSSVYFSHFKLLLRNHWANWNQTQQECSLDSPLQSFCFSFQSDIQHGCQGQ